jgi:glutathione reductase (NADPH)
VEITLIETGEQILSGFDDDIRSGVQNGLSQRGIKFFGNTTATEIKQDAEELQLILSGDRSPTITADTILIATGRSPNTKDLGLENTGVEVGEKGAIQVDDYSRTSQENIFAVGDCTNRVPLSPVARSEGRAIANTLFGNQPQKINYEYVPSAVFARPEAAAVGMSEAKAREKFGESVQCFRTEFEPLFYSMTNQKEQAMMKLVVEQKSDRVLGAHMVGEHAADIIQSLAVAIKQGVTKQDLVATIGIHPTTGEEFLLLD